MDKIQYEDTVRNFSDSLYRFTRRLYQDNERAKDSVQECFVRLWQYDKKVEHPKAFLFQTAYRLFVDEKRREKTMQEYTLHTRRTAMDEEKRQNAFYSGEENRELIEQALQKLPDIQKTVVMLRDYEGYSYQEIEKITGLSEAQVKTYIFRARLALRKLIGKPENILG